MIIQRSRGKGFTLIELMIVVAVVALIATLGYPAYTRQVQSTRQAAVQGDLMAAATAMEAWRSQNFTYTGGAAALPPALTGNQFYNVNTVIAPDGLSYTITITPRANGVMEGTSAMAIDSRNRTCISTSSTGCTIGTDPSWK
jgi:type IV pilus assembly protein PilE